MSQTYFLPVLFDYFKHEFNKTAVLFFVSSAISKTDHGLGLRKVKLGAVSFASKLKLSVNL
jgi:hypothetical protein